MLFAVLIWTHWLGAPAYAAPVASPPAKQIVSTAEILPNYIMHLFLVSGVWDGADKSYAHRYAETVRKEDKTFMKSKRGLVAWGNMAGSEFAMRVFFLPVYKGLSSESRDS